MVLVKVTVMDPDMVTVVVTVQVLVSVVVTVTGMEPEIVKFSFYHDYEYTN